MSATTSISTDGDVATLINVFTVDPEGQQRLVQLLSDATEKVVRHRPGFVSANIHASVDGSQVVNYAQWRTAEDLQAMLSDPSAGEHLAAVRELAVAEPHLYRVAATHHV